MDKEILEKEFSKCIVPHDTNFKCSICNKPFVGPEYVKKHIKNKHRPEVEQRILKALNNGKSLDEQMRENYIADPAKKINQPVANQNRQRRPFFKPQDRRKEETEPRKQYIDFDDPAVRQQELQKKEQEAVSYDDLF